MPRTKRKERPFDLFTSIYDGVRDVRKIIWVDCHGNGVPGLGDGDLLLVDCLLKRPKDGDFVCRQRPDGSFSLSEYDSDYVYDDPIYGIGVCIVRKIDRKRLRATSLKDDAKKREAEIATLTRKLDRIERLPENESERFKLETEIYNITREADAAQEWPDVIGGGR